jgi:haloalkane dehalogenase
MEQPLATHSQHSSSAHTLSQAQVMASFRGPPHARLDIGHSRLAYYRFGSGPDLVFVHGWPLHAATFRALIPVLATRFTCHLVDLPGAGQTACSADTPFDLVAQARSLRAAVDVLGLTRYALLAHDSGGGIARLLMADDTRVAGLVSGPTEIPGHTPFVVRMVQRACSIPGGFSLMIAAMRSRLVRSSSLGFGGCFADPAFAEGEFGSLFVAPLLGSAEYARLQSQLIRQLDHGVVEGLRDTHARMRAPVLLIWGEEDPIFPLEKARAMLGQFGGPVALEALPRGKCFVHEEQPAAFLALAQPFLEARLYA